MLASEIPASTKSSVAFVIKGKLGWIKNVFFPSELFSLTFHPMYSIVLVFVFFLFPDTLKLCGKIYII